MLKGIDQVLRGELLKALDELGHGDELALVDRNYPAKSSGVTVIDLGEITAVRAVQAIFSVLPLDVFGDSPLRRMEVEDDPSKTNPTQEQVLEIANASMGKDWDWGVIQRLNFYSAVKATSLVIRCQESAPYACFIFRKGIVSES